MGLTKDSKMVPVNHPVRDINIRDFIPVYSKETEEKEEVMQRINFGIKVYDEDIDMADEIDHVPDFEIELNKMRDVGYNEDLLNELDEFDERPGRFEKQNQCSTQLDITHKSDDVSRFHIKKRLKIGNNSKYLENGNLYLIKTQIFYINGLFM